MIHCSVPVLSGRVSDFQHGNRVSPHCPPRQHTKYAALHRPRLCMCVHADMWISCTDTTFPPTPLWLGTPVKVAGNGSGAKKAAIDTVPG